MLSAKKTMEMLPGVAANGLRGGVLYHDGQFDDARYAISLMRTFEELGGVAINYVEATGLIERDGKTRWRACARLRERCAGLNCRRRRS